MPQVPPPLRPRDPEPPKRPVTPPSARLSPTTTEATASPSLVASSSSTNPVLGQPNSGSFLRSLSEGLMSTNAGANAFSMPARSFLGAGQLAPRPADPEQVSAVAYGLVQNGSSHSGRWIGSVENVAEVEAEVNKLREENAFLASDIDREKHIIEIADSHIKKLQEQIEQARMSADPPDTAERIKTMRALSGNL
eukprot:gnl/MRDRNA2_/MRDRNA2_66185_c0_seq1.p1 gnl/MRDRNA2_/MRDRNA2_66185_c0~~gnl/MRDRNA2_/MRDRNA2_66185_c0_seq1.p1  ORF type:complete len:222 (-),score=58.15 gnl/MRDRNA2_/MRDRNA2_66185_c0_seq1:175-756(-)